MTDRCQGCGVEAGAPLVITKGSKRLKAVVRPAELTATTFADYGTRRFCQRCRKGAGEVVGRIRAAHRKILPV
jgi:hypothetical protein